MRSWTCFPMAAVLVVSLSLPAAAALPNQRHQARLAAGVPGGTIETAGVLSTAFPLLNRGGAVADKVEVTAVSLAGTPVTCHTPLPIRLGALPAGGSATVFATLAGKDLAAGRVYSMKIEGRFTSAGRTQAFALEHRLRVPPGSPGSARVSTASIASQEARGTRYRPHRVPLPREINHSNGWAVPLGKVSPSPQNSEETVVETAPAPEVDPPPMRVFANRPVKINGNVVNEPSGATSDAFTPPAAAAGKPIRVIFVTFNQLAAFSIDGGMTFTKIDPTTIFPPSDGGFCCDQVVQFIPSIRRFVWVMQTFGSDPANDPFKGPNRERLAAASPEEIVGSNGQNWHFWDFTPAALNFDSTDVLDYPDLAVGNNFLYLSFDEAQKQGLVVVRVPLSQIQSGGSLAVDFTNPDDSSVAYISHLTQHPQDQIFWAGHNSSSSLRIFSLPEGSSNYSWQDVDIGNWPNDTGKLTSKTPDGQDWLSDLATFPEFPIRGATRVTAGGSATAGPSGASSTDQLWLAWTASAGNQFSQPHIEWVELDIKNHFTLISQQQLFSNKIAFAYPGLSTNSHGEVGASLEVGGGPSFENHAIGFPIDHHVFRTTASSAGTPRYGDYVTIRSDTANMARFDAFGYGVIKPVPPSKTPTTDTRFVDFGRGPTPPNTFSFLELTVATGDDDLRDDSLSTATLLDSSSQTFQKLILREQNQPAWKDDTHVIDFALASPVTASQLGSLVLTLKQGGSFPETQDNWDISRVRARLFNTDPAAAAPVCLFDQSGAPLVRLTGSGPSKTFMLAPTPCP